MTTIVDRLREQAAADEKAGTLYSHELLREAADEIEHLRIESQILLDTITTQINQIHLALKASHSGFTAIFEHRSECVKRKKEST